MLNLGNILQNSLFYHLKFFLKKIISEKFRHLFLELFFADPAPGLWYILLKCNKVNQLECNYFKKALKKNLVILFYYVAKYILTN
jgi:hypothetical protein